MAIFASINHSSISIKLKLFWCNNSQYAVIISYSIIDIFSSASALNIYRENYGVLGILPLKCYSSHTKRCYHFLFFDTNINNMKQQIKKMKKIYFSEKP